MKEEIKRLKEQLAKYEKAIVSLTPSGSEFANDPDACVEYVNGFQKSQDILVKKLIKEKKDLEEQIVFTIKYFEDLILENYERIKKFN